MFILGICEGDTEGITMHSVPVTQEMKDSVMEGQLMFSRVMPGIQAFGFAKNAEEFDEIIKKSKAEHGLVAPNLHSTQFKVVGMGLHKFNGTLRQAEDAAREWAKKYLVREEPYTAHKGTDEQFQYTISAGSIKEFFEGTAHRRMSNNDKAGFMSILEHLTEVVDASHVVEVHPDYLEKESNGNRNPDGQINPNMLIVVANAVVNVADQPFRVSMTFKETRNDGTPLYAYNLEKIELSGDTSTGANTPSGPLYAPNSYVSSAKLLNGVEKSYDPGKELLDASLNIDNEGNIQDISPESAEEQEEASRSYRGVP